MQESKLERGEVENKERVQGQSHARWPRRHLGFGLELELGARVRVMQDCRDTGLFWWLADSWLKVVGG